MWHSLRKGTRLPIWSYSQCDSLWNLESNKTSPSSLAQKLSEIWDFKNGIWKRSLEKLVFKSFGNFFYNMKFVYSSKFLSSNSVLLCKNKMCYQKSRECHIKVHTFFYQNQWKSKIRIFWPWLQKVAITRFPGSATWSFFSENATYWTPKHHHVCSDKAIDKIRLFLANQLALIRAESKFCMGRLWNELYSMLTCAKALPVAPLIVMIWWGIP